MGAGEGAGAQQLKVTTLATFEELQEKLDELIADLDSDGFDQLMSHLAEIRRDQFAAEVAVAYGVPFEPEPEPEQVFRIQIRRLPTVGVAEAAKRFRTMFPTDTAKDALRKARGGFVVGGSSWYVRELRSALAGVAEVTTTLIS